MKTKNGSHQNCRIKRVRYRKIRTLESATLLIMKQPDAIELSLFAQRVNAVCDEMGAQLRHAAFSPNIRDRLDYSCALFDAEGALIAQAAHIPVHLGSMAYAMKSVVALFEWASGDQVIFNDPYLGGTHLPDVTLVAPVFIGGQLAAFVANRAHYADIGSIAPGSMPLTSVLEEEGVLLRPQKLVVAGELDHEVMQVIVSATRSPADTLGDINAQMGCNIRGIARSEALIVSMGLEGFNTAVGTLNEYAEILSLKMVKQLPAGCYTASDYMEDDGQGNSNIPIQATMTVDTDCVEIDFTGTADQVGGNINCPFSVTVAAVWYVLRSLMPRQTPACAGCFRPIRIQAPAGSLVNATFPAAVAAGNVETSSRIVDVMMRLLSQLIPERIPALSQGTMNNFAFGADVGEQAWGYYETIGGGMGAGPGTDGLSAVQSHMTNTRNTPVEVLEMRYPIRIGRYEIRTDSGGRGKRRGGDGIVREFVFTRPAVCTLLTERRRLGTAGVQGGSDGMSGRNWLDNRQLAAKCSFHVQAGERVIIETPGGGGWGSVI